MQHFSNSHLAVSKIRAEMRDQYDLFIGSCGYETRSIYLLNQLNNLTRWSLVYGFDYAINRQAFVNQAIVTNLKDNLSTSSLKFHARVSQSRFARLLSSDLEEILEGHCKGCLKVAVDISSAPTSRLADCLSTLLIMTENHECEIDFLYAHGEGYRSDRTPPTIEKDGPVTEDFCGWHGDPSLPIAGVFCVGLESAKSIGAYENISPALSHVFWTGAESSELRRHVERANDLLFRLTPPSQVHLLDVYNFPQSYFNLQSLCDGLIERHRIVLVPMGPKTFSMCALLYAALRYPEVSVWNFSSGSSIRPTNITANGKVSVLRARVERRLGNVRDDGLPR